MDQQALPTTDEIVIEQKSVKLDRDTANALFDVRWTCDDGGLFDLTKYPPARLRQLRAHELIKDRPDIAEFIGELTERGRLCTVSIADSRVAA